MEEMNSGGKGLMSEQVVDLQAKVSQLEIQIKEQNDLMKDLKAILVRQTSYAPEKKILGSD
ncbi:hypothetical protein HQN64_05070 [Enterobacteriaceae bacterium BIT-l23]|uniref:hypothetical protein n=1 Tax=Jejubacter sp. L23 TaxID=3092086 RepID=UPI0015845984|nr:hypothetical protein [Enterobacteriaceae bacterium BIT-l23]